MLKIACEDNSVKNEQFASLFTNLSVNPVWHECQKESERLRKIADALGEAKRQGGVVGGIKRIGLSAAAAASFARLYFLKPRRNALPADARLTPAC